MLNSLVPYVAMVLAAIGGLFLAWLNGRSAKAAEVVKEDLKHAEVRAEEVQRADAAADRVRVDAGSKPNSLREHDKFERS